MFNQELFALPPKVFGCVVFVQNHTLGLDKLASWALKCVFVRYSRARKGYRCYHPPTRRYLVSVGVTFLESKSFFEVAESVFVVKSVPFPSPIPVISIESDKLVQIEQQVSKPLQVYHRRQRPPMPTSTETAPTSTSADLPHSDLLTALRKSSRSTTAHPISTFVIYDNLHHSFRHFALSIST